MAFRDANREEQVVELPGSLARALVAALKAEGLNVEIDAPHPRLYYSVTDRDHWYGTDVEGAAWIWPRGPEGWAQRRAHVIEPYHGALCFVPRHLADVSGYPWINSATGAQ